MGKISKVTPKMESKDAKDGINDVKGLPEKKKNDSPGYGDLCLDDAEIIDPIDPWALTAPKNNGKPWKEMTGWEKTKRVLLNIAKGIAVLVLLYFFIVSIDLLGSAFQLLAGRTAGGAFTNVELLNNPVSCMMIGVGVTVLLQSSSTSTSIVVTMVAAGIIPVQNGIYIIMGANIGTSVTNTIVAMGQIADKDEFRRAFAGATVHDMFNWMSVLIILPIEVATGYLYHLTLEIVNKIDINTDINEPQFLEVITDPLASAIIEIDKNVIYGIAEDAFEAKRPLAKYLCEQEPYTEYIDFANLDTDVIESKEYKEVKDSREYPNYWAYNERVELVNVTYDNGTSYNVQRFSWDLPSFNESSATESCRHLFTGAGLPSSYDSPSGWPEINLSDAAAGGILLVVSLITLCACLIGMVKVLNSLLQGPVLKIVHKVLNTEFQCGDKAPKACNIFGREIAGYLSMLVGCGLTILVQSSSVFTSAMTPLVGMGLITVERMYPLTLGANIGTTVTSMLAAFTSDPEMLRDALQVSLAHLFFNLSGILIFYPIPVTRKVPVYLAKQLGNTTADYRWFAMAYLIVVFFILPTLVFALSIPGWYVLAAVLIPCAILIIFLVVINIFRKRCMNILPKRLQSWNWCPRFLCSLEPYDRLFKKCCGCCKVCQEPKETKTESNKVGFYVNDVKMKMSNGKLQYVENDLNDCENGVANGCANQAYEVDDNAEKESSRL